MNENELRVLLEQLRAEGWQPMLCDTDLPFYDRNVSCGEPTMVWGDAPESMPWPKDLLSMHPEFTVVIKGDSMMDAGLMSGDIMKVTCDIVPQDGDIVLASIDGESTIKVYCEDDEGRPWLVPQNKAYKPIMLRGKTNVRIIGLVKEIIKSAPRIAYRECMSIIRKAKQELKTDAAQVTAMPHTEAEEVAMARAAPKDKREDAPVATEDLVAKLKPIFFNNEGDVRTFLKEIDGMKDKDITDLVNRWVKEKRISNYGNSRKGVLWGILNAAGLYQPSRQNWCRRVE